jgi:hypothetical protein
VQCLITLACVQLRVVKLGPPQEKFALAKIGFDMYMLPAINTGRNN